MSSAINPLVFPEAVQIEIEAHLPAERAQFAVCIPRGNEMQALANRLGDSGAARLAGMSEQRMGHVNGDLLEGAVLAKSFSHWHNVP